MMVDLVVYTDDGGMVRALTPPGGMTAEETRRDADLVPQDRPTFIVDSASLPATDIRLWHLSADGRVTSESPPPPRIVVSRLRLKLALIAAGKLADVETAVMRAGATAMLYWTEATDFESDHRLVAQIGAALGMTADEIYALFVAARDLEA
jgi:hypothetical protein